MDIIIRNARISDKESLKDVAIKDGKIIKIEENMAEKASEEIDADGRVLIPGLVESHIHMDKALIADRLPNRSGTLAEAIKVTAELKPTFTKEDVEEKYIRDFLNYLKILFVTNLSSISFNRVSLFIYKKYKIIFLYIVLLTFKKNMVYLH